MDGVVGIGKYINSGNGLNVAYNEQHDAIANDNLSSVTGVRSPGSYRYQDEKDHNLSVLISIFWIDM